ncbi:hypothetical protein GCM10010522_31730 [Kribbella solani]
MMLGQVNRVRVTVGDLRGAVEAELRRSWSDAAWVRWLDAAAVLRDQSFRNVVLIKLQMPGAEMVEGRQGWLRRGRRIARGASGIRIVAPALEAERSVGPVQGHAVATVWDVSQTDGRPIESSPGRQSHDVFAALEHVAAAGGYRVERGRLAPGGGGAETVRRQGLIVVADDLELPLATMGLAYELAHLKMHKGSRDSVCHGVARLEATSAAYVLLSRFGCLPGRPSADLMARTTGIVGRASPVRQIETLGGRVVATANRLFAAAELYLPADIPPASPQGASRQIGIDSFVAESAGQELEP